MPLPLTTLRRLSAYAFSRDGIDLPATAAGPIAESACWSWAAAGGLLAVHDQLSADHVYESIADVDDTTTPATLRGFRDLRAFFGCDAQFDTLAAEQDAAIAGDAAAQGRCAVALMWIFASLHNLRPVAGDGHPYQLHLTTRSWFGWNHWGISVLLPDQRRMFLQTVTGVPLAYASDRMWDEGLTEHVLGLADLLPAHIDVIRTIPPAPVESAKCNTCHTTPASTPAAVRSWHRCNLCGTIWCPPHSKTLGGKLPWSGTRQCGQGDCFGRTELL